MTEETMVGILLFSIRIMGVGVVACKGMNDTLGEGVAMSEEALTEWMTSTMDGYGTSILPGSNIDRCCYIMKTNKSTKSDAAIDRYETLKNLNECPPP